jgi:hypothetical protein
MVALIDGTESEVFEGAMWLLSAGEKSRSSGAPFGATQARSGRRVFHKLHRDGQAHIRGGPFPVDLWKTRSRSGRGFRAFEGRLWTRPTRLRGLVMDSWREARQQKAAGTLPAMHLPTTKRTCPQPPLCCLVEMGRISDLSRGVSRFRFPDLVGVYGNGKQETADL